MYEFILFILTITGSHAASTECCHGLINTKLTNLHSLENVLQVFENVGTSFQCTLLCLSEDFCSRIYFNAVDEVCQTHSASLSSESYTPRIGGMFYEMECNRVCPKNLGYISYQNLCYKISTIKKTWNDARTACLEESGDLIKLNSLEKHEYIKTQLSNSAGYHIGGSDEAVEGTWEWVDGEGISGGYMGWAHGEPNSEGKIPQNCMMIAAAHSFGWSDVKCDREEPFICEIQL